MECLLEWSEESPIKALFNMKDIVSRLREFMDNEARSCSMDFGCITPLYVYRMWGGTVAIDEIVNAMAEVRFLM